MNRNKEACHCRNVTYGMIEDAIKNGAHTLQEVQNATGAAKGCGQCKDFLACLIRDIKEELYHQQVMQRDSRVRAEEGKMNPDLTSSAIVPNSDIRWLIGGKVICYPVGI